MASDWRQVTTEQQQFWCDTIGYLDFDEYEPNKAEGLLILKKKIGFAIYGLPQEEPSKANDELGYEKKAVEHIKKVASCILKVIEKKPNEKNLLKPKEKNLLSMSIVFVYVETKSHSIQLPVFRVLLTDCEWKFVDTDCRVYATWKNFLTENVLPEGKFCWPKNGIYQSDSKGNVDLEWGVTPKAKIGTKVLSGLDVGASAVGLGSAGVAALTLIAPVAAPLAAAAGVCMTVTGLYSGIRSAATLKDRDTHQQDINPFTNKEAAASWLCVVGSTVGLAAGANVNHITNLARNGQVISKTEQIVCNALNFTSLAVNATGVVYGAVFISERVKDQEVTALDIFQFCTSVLFFAHATVNFQTASTIVKNTQKSVITEFENSLRSNRHRKQFKKLAKSTAASSDTVIEGNAKVIRSIRNIDNVDDFFAGMVRIRKDLGGSRTVFSENGNIIIDGGVEIHPMKMYELGKQQRVEVLSLARRAADGGFLDVSFVDSLSQATGTKSPTTSTKMAQRENAEVALTTQLKTMVKNWNISTEDVRLVIVVVDELTDLVHKHIKKSVVQLWHKIWTHISKLALMMLETYQDVKKFDVLFRKFMNGEKLDLDTIQKGAEFSYFVVKIYVQYKDHISDLISDLSKDVQNENHTEGNAK